MYYEASKIPKNANRTKNKGNKFISIDIGKCSAGTRNDTFTFQVTVFTVFRVQEVVFFSHF